MTAAVIQLQRRAAARTAAAVQLPPQNDIQGFETYTSPLNGGQRLRMNCRGFEDFVSLGSVGNALDNGRGEDRVLACLVLRDWAGNGTQMNADGRGLD